MRSAQELTLSQRKKTPSFSSSLLDAIYRSIDEDETIRSSATSTTTTDAAAATTTVTTTATTTTTTANNDFSNIGHHEVETTSIKTHGETVVIACCKRDEIVKMARRPPLEPIVIEKPRVVFRIDKQFPNSAWSSSSSDSSCKEGASTALFSPSSTSYRAISLPSCFTPVRSKQIRTGNSTRSDVQQSKQQKQNVNPISPGRRISIILNSIFNAKKKRNAAADKKSSKSTATTAIAAAAATSTTTSSKDQSSTPKLYMEQSKQHQKHNSDEFDDDVESNASSDLFEIENLVGFGGKYVEELPVYGTTDFKINQAVVRKVLQEHPIKLERYRKD